MTSHSPPALGDDREGGESGSLLAGYLSIALVIAVLGLVPNFNGDIAARLGISGADLVTWTCVAMALFSAFALWPRATRGKARTKAAGEQPTGASLEAGQALN